MNTCCNDCDRPLATPEDYNTIPEGQGEHLCWRSWNADVCLHPATSWRTRALDAESALQEAHLAFAALVAERDGRDRAIEALTRRVAELLPELRRLRAFYAKFRHAEIESWT